MKTITTPKGKRLSDKQYVALRSAISYNPNNNRERDTECEHGHFECAVWKGGPCFDEVLSRIDREEGN